MENQPNLIHSSEFLKMSSTSSLIQPLQLHVSYKQTNEYTNICPLSAYIAKHNVHMHVPCVVFKFPQKKILEDLRNIKVGTSVACFRVLSRLFYGEHITLLFCSILHEVEIYVHSATIKSQASEHRQMIC